jgi:hypothetical protein
MMTSRRPVAAQGLNERAATDALLFRLNQELAARFGVPDGGRLAG